MWWNAVEVMNILINFALIALPVWIVSKVQVSFLRKFSVGSMFGLRIMYMTLGIVFPALMLTEMLGSVSPRPVSSSTGTEPDTLTT